MAGPDGEPVSLLGRFWGGSCWGGRPTVACVPLESCSPPRVPGFKAGGPHSCNLCSPCICTFTGPQLLWPSQPTVQGWGSLVELSCILGA